MNMTQYIIASDYKKCRALLTSAFLCLTGTQSDDERLRKAIELVLDAVKGVENAAPHTNVVKFRRKATSASE